MARNAAFSLFELLAALAIVSLVVAVAAPPVSTMLDKLAFRKEVNSFMAQVRGWKLLAVSKGRPVTIILEDRSLVVQLTKTDEDRIFIDEELTLAMEPTTIHFSPEGWATPALIDISSQERHRRVRINPLTAQPERL